MGKTAPPKKKGGKYPTVHAIESLSKCFPASSVHSRAAKRASSPSIDTDKSLKNIDPPIKSKNLRPSVLAVHQGAGVSKKSKNGRKSVLSAKAKRRQEKGLDRAEAVIDKKEKKIEKSKGKARNVQERSKAWDELNKKMIARRAREEEALEREREQMIAEEEDEVKMQDSFEEKDAPTPAIPTAVSLANVAQSAPMRDPGDDDVDEVL